MGFVFCFWGGGGGGGGGPPPASGGRDCRMPGGEGLIPGGMTAGGRAPGGIIPGGIGIAARELGPAGRVTPAASGAGGGGGVSIGMRRLPLPASAPGLGRPRVAASSSAGLVLGGGGAFGSTGSQNTTGGSAPGVPAGPLPARPAGGLEDAAAAGAVLDGWGADQAGARPLPAASRGRTSTRREPRTVEAISAGGGTERT